MGFVNFLKTCYLFINKNHNYYNFIGANAMPIMVTKPCRCVDNYQVNNVDTRDEFNGGDSDGNDS